MSPTSAVPTGADTVTPTARSPGRSRKTQTAGVMRIGTRASALALKQARLVQAALVEQGLVGELVTFKTVGDKRLDEPLNGIGGKGLFTHELERALELGKIDCAVHSLKDLPTDLGAGLTVAAVLARADPRDVLVLSSTARAVGLADLPRGSRVGTSSLRRRAQLLAVHPDLEVVELRGNVPTRLRKVDEGQVHAAILAAAGLLRLGATQHIAAFLEAPGWLPAAGQGAIAVQVRSDDVQACACISMLNDPATMYAVQAERAFLAGLDGGCQVPIGAVVIGADGNAGLHRGGAAAPAMLHGLIAEPSGRRVIRGSRPLTDDPMACGRGLAADLRARGADEILAALRSLPQVVAPQPE
jgi:hydroxymethylbilane synthase